MQALIETMQHFEWKNKDLYLRLKIVPRSSKNAVAGLLDDRLKINITAAPTDGIANDHLVKWLAKLCGVSKSSVTIVSGEANRSKTVSIVAPKVLPDALQVSSNRNAASGDIPFRR
jgi:uncharacterized protein